MLFALSLNVLHLLFSVLERLSVQPASAGLEFVDSLLGQVGAANFFNLTLKKGAFDTLNIVEEAEDVGEGWRRGQDQLLVGDEDRGRLLALLNHARVVIGPLGHEPGNNLGPVFELAPRLFGLRRVREQVS